MKRIAIVTEGQTEQIFVRELLSRFLDISTISFECIDLRADREYSRREFLNPYASVHFVLINVQNDERVISFIGERIISLIDRGRYDRIIGLRDLYSKEYEQFGHGTFNTSSCSKFINSHNATIQSMTYSERIALCFAVMETEAWFLGMYDLFARIDSSLTVEYIGSKLGIDLRAIDPQTEFYHPSKTLASILELSGRTYDKKKADIEGICGKLLSTDLSTITANGRCSFFAAFFKEITDSFN